MDGRERVDELMALDQHERMVGVDKRTAGDDWMVGDERIAEDDWMSESPDEWTDEWTNLDERRAEDD